MLICTTHNDLIQYLNPLRQRGLTIGFVPTMGALHAGHIALVMQSMLHNDVTICSIFINPTQFNNEQDFLKYPVTLEHDKLLLTQAGCQVLWLPTLQEVYPNGLSQLKKYAFGYIETVLDGAARPGHYQGVGNVVEKLLHVVQPHNAYFGLKDYQQCLIIKKLIKIMQWEHILTVHLCPTYREPNGLAMSSRNQRLTQAQRLLAPLLYQKLCYIKAQLNTHNQASLLQLCIVALEQVGFVVDYISIANASTLELIPQWNGKQPSVCLLAAFIGDIRLIDNVMIP